MPLVGQGTLQDSVIYMRMTFRKVAFRAIVIPLALIGTASLATALYLLRPVSTPAFRDEAARGLPQSIASMERWPINGMDQSVILRGRDRGSPLLVWVHGGPETSETGVVRRCNSALEDLLPSFGATAQRRLPTSVDVESNAKAWF